MHRRAGSVSMAVLTLAALAAAPVLAQEGRIKVGDVRPYAAETPHPYPKTWTDRVFSPGAEFVRVHFTGLHLGDGDSLTVSSPDGSQVWTYTGKGPHGNGDVWSFAIDGDTAIVQLQGGRGNGWGYRITEVGHGLVDITDKKKQDSPVLEVVCGTDGRENIACHTNEAVIDAAQKAVGRMLFVDGAFQYVCTGSLVRGSNASTMLSNYHCISKQSVLNTLQVKFNYQTTTCGGSTIGTTTDYAGGTLLKTSSDRYAKRTAGSGLDYSLFTLLGNPEGTWGELIPTTRTYATGTPMNFIQHPGGNPKKIGYWEDTGMTPVRCKIDTINATYGTAAPNSQTGYGCDSEGGSSGSPITAATDGKAIALHHYGGVSSAPCLNSATMMSKVCANAGTLLTCDSN